MSEGLTGKIVGMVVAAAVTSILSAMGVPKGCARTGGSVAGEVAAYKVDQTFTPSPTPAHKEETNRGYVNQPSQPTPPRRSVRTNVAMVSVPAGFFNGVLRDGPSFSSAKIAEIPNGTVVSVLRVSDTNDSHKRWYFIRHGSLSGWMHQDVLNQIDQDLFFDDIRAIVWVVQDRWLATISVVFAVTCKALATPIVPTRWITTTVRTNILAFFCF